MDVHAFAFCLHVHPAMRVLVFVAFTTAALAVTGCHKSQPAASSQAALQPQEVNWNQNQSPAPSTDTATQPPAQPVVLASAQVAVNGSNVTARVSNVKAGTELTLAWFGPSGWNVVNESQIVNGDTVTFAVPKFETPGRYEAELLNGTQLLGTVDVNV